MFRGNFTKIRKQPFCDNPILHSDAAGQLEITKAVAAPSA